MRYSETHEEAALFMLRREHQDLPVVARFTVDGEPVSKSRARFTGYGSKVRAYTPEATLTGERRVREAFRAAASDHQPSADDTYGVTALFFHATRQRRDVDNMLKLILDGLNKVAWVDDSQVIEVSGRKAAELPGNARTEVVIYRIGTVERPTTPCQHCGKGVPFYPGSRRKFCGRPCVNAYRKTWGAKTCEHCGNKFVRSEASHAGQRFCCRECAYASKHLEVACAACGKSFTKARSLARSGNNYCSPECKAHYWREQRKSAAKGTCQDCGGPTTKKTYKRCRDCNYAAGGRHAT